MATRTLVLASAASLLIAGALIAAAPVLAQSGNDFAQAYSSANAQYDSELETYSRRQQVYERERSEYNDKINDYQRSLNAFPRLPDAVIVDDPAPEIVVVERDDFAERLAIRNIPPLVRLEDVADVNYALFNAPVLDSAGLPVGHFRRIETKVPGDLVAVVTLSGSRRTISMLTEHVRFDPDRRTIISDLTARQIDRIPSGFPYG